MDVFTIVFAGLIAHVLTDSGAQRAVLVAAPEHEARLIVDAADVIENRGFERDARGGFRLEGERITIDGIPRGEATFEASYLRNVPSLSRISDATALIPEIETAAPHQAVAAYVDLGRGTFSAPETWDSQVSFGGRAQCIARSVRFRAPVGGNVTFRTAGGKALRVRGGATVHIANDPPDGANGSHFHMYADLLHDATRLAEPVSLGLSCATGRRRVAPHGIRADTFAAGCSDSQWP